MCHIFSSCCFHISSSSLDFSSFDNVPRCSYLCIYPPCASLSSLYPPVLEISSHYFFTIFCLTFCFLFFCFRELKFVHMFVHFLSIFFLCFSYWIISIVQPSSLLTLFSATFIVKLNEFSISNTVFQL